MPLRVSGSKGLRREGRLSNDGSVSVCGCGCGGGFLPFFFYSDNLDTKAVLFRDRRVHS